MFQHVVKCSTKIRHNPTRPNMFQFKTCYGKFQHVPKKHVPKSLSMFQHVLTRWKCFKSFKMFQKFHYVSNCFKLKCSKCKICFQMFHNVSKISNSFKKFQKATGCLLKNDIFELLISRSKNGQFWSNLCLKFIRHSTFCKSEQKFWTKTVKIDKNSKNSKIAFL